MRYASQRGKREAEKFLRSIVEQSDKLENWVVGSYTLEENSSLLGSRVTLTLSLRPSKPFGWPKPGEFGMPKAGRGTASGSQPGRRRRGGAKP